MKNNMRKLLSLVMTVMMLVQFMPLSAFATAADGVAPTEDKWTVKFLNPAKEVEEFFSVAKDSNTNLAVSPGAALVPAAKSYAGFDFLAWVDENGDNPGIVNSDLEFSPLYLPKDSFLIKEDNILICAEAHTHGPACYGREYYNLDVEVQPGHVHSDSCVSNLYKLACDTNHEHTFECYLPYVGGTIGLFDVSTNYTLDRFVEGVWLVLPDGSEISLLSPPPGGITINLGDEYELKFQFHINEPLAQTTYSYAIPALLSGNPEESEAKLDVVGMPNTNFGTAKLSKTTNNLEVTFNDQAVKATQNGGASDVFTFKFHCRQWIDENELIKDRDEPYEFPLGGGDHSMTIIVEKTDIVPEATSKTWVRWDRTTGRFVWEVRVKAPDPARETIFYDEFVKSGSNKEHTYVANSLQIAYANSATTKNPALLIKSAPAALAADSTRFGGFSMVLNPFDEDIIVTYETEPVGGYGTLYAAAFEDKGVFNFVNRVQMRWVDEDGVEHKQKDSNGRDQWRSATANLTINMFDKADGIRNGDKLSWDITLIKMNAGQVTCGYVNLPANTTVTDTVPQGAMWGTGAGVKFTGKVDGIADPFVNADLPTAANGNSPWYEAPTAANGNKITVHFPGGLSASAAASLTVTLLLDEATILSSNPAITKITNTATLHNPATGAEDLSDSGDIGVGKTTLEITKSGEWNRTATGGTIKWSVKVSGSAYARELLLKDFFNNQANTSFEHVYVADSMKIGTSQNPTTKVEAATTLVDMSKSVAGAKNFTLYLKPFTGDIYITYETAPGKIGEIPFFDAVADEASYTFTNRIQMFDGTGVTPYGNELVVDLTRKVERIDKEAGTSAHGLYSWRINLIKTGVTTIQPHIPANFQNPSYIIDTIPYGLVFDAARGSSIKFVGKLAGGTSSITVDNVGTSSTDGKPYYAYNATAKELRIYFPGGIASDAAAYLVITLSESLTTPPDGTHADGTNPLTLRNIAQLIINGENKGGTGTGEGVGPIPYTTPGVTKGGSWSKSKGAIEWWIKVTPPDPDRAVTVEDVFNHITNQTTTPTYSGMKHTFDPGSMEVWLTSGDTLNQATATKLTLGTHYSYTPTTTTINGEAVEGFNVVLNANAFYNGTAKAYQNIFITYRTLPDASLVLNSTSNNDMLQFSNRVRLLWNNWTSSWLNVDVYLYTKLIVKTYTGDPNKPNEPYSWDITLMDDPSANNTNIQVDLPANSYVLEKFPSELVWNPATCTVTYTGTGAYVDKTQLSGYPVLQGESATHPYYIPDTANPNNIQIHFPEGISAKALAKLTITIPADGTSVDFGSKKNEVELWINGKDSSKHSDFDTFELKKPLRLDKTPVGVFDMQTNRAEWTITANQNESALGNLVVVDELNIGDTKNQLELVSISIDGGTPITSFSPADKHWTAMDAAKATGVNADGEPVNVLAEGLIWVGYATDDGTTYPNSFAVHFGSTSDAHTITVVTKLRDVKIPNNSTTTETVRNRATLYMNGSTTENRGQVAATQQYTPPVKKTFIGSDTTTANAYFTGANKLKPNEVAWQLELRKPTGFASKLVYEDNLEVGKFSENQNHWVLRRGTTTVARGIDEKPSALPSINTYLVSQFGAGSELKKVDENTFQVILFNSASFAATETLTLVYVSFLESEDYAENLKPEVRNKVTLLDDDGNGSIWEGGHKGDAPVRKDFDKGGTLNAKKQVDWTITINETARNILPLEDTTGIVTLTENLQAGLKLIRGSISMVKTDSEGNVVPFISNKVTFVEYDVDSNPATLEASLLTIDFDVNDVIDHKIVVSFTTDVLLTATYTNSASLSGFKDFEDTEIMPDLKAQAEASVTYAAYLQVNKVDESGTLEGVEFILYEETDADFVIVTVPDGKLVTDSNGNLPMLRLEDADGLDNFNVLKLGGKYYLQEVKASAPGHTLIPGSYTHPVSNKTIENAMKLDNRHNIYGSLEVENRKLYTEFTVHKLDSRDDQKNLAGAAFVLTDKLEGGSTAIFTEDPANVYTFIGFGTGEPTELLTGANGKFTVKNLPYGDYILKETKEPVAQPNPKDEYIPIDQDNQPIWNVNVTSDYLNSNHQLTITISEHAESTAVADSKWAPVKGDTTKGELTVENERKQVYVDLEILKIDESTSKKQLIGAEFTLIARELLGAYAESESGVAGFHTDRNDGTTPATGIVKTTTAAKLSATFDQLVPGVYELTESIAPAGYFKLETIWTVNINADGNITIYEGEDISTTAIINVAGQYEICNTEVRGTLKLYKVDQDGNPLTGAAFTLTAVGDEDSDGECDGVSDSIVGHENGITYGPEVVTNVDDDGYYVFDEIPQGSYILKETKIPEGYRTPEEWDVVVDVDGNVTIDGVEVEDGTIDVGEFYKIFNQLAMANLAIIKIDEEATPVKFLNGAGFTLNAEQIYSDKITDLTPYQNLTATTDAKGEAVFENLPAGVYTLEESHRPDGYNQALMSWTVTVNSDDTVTFAAEGDTDTNSFVFDKKLDLTSSYKIYNKQVTGNLQIFKRDGDKVLTGAGFTLRSKAIKDDDNNGIDYAQDGIQNETPTSGGYYEFTKIPVGTYELEETKIPGGYRTPSVWEVNVADDGKVSIKDSEGVSLLDGTQIDVTSKYVIQNNEIRVNLDIFKMDDDEDPNYLIGAVFSLTAKTITGAENTIEFKAQTADPTSAENVYKASFTNIPEGTFILKEEVVPEGYTKEGNKDTWEVVVDAQGVITVDKNPVQGGIDVTPFYNINNVKIKSSFSIFKMDDHGVGLAGATFRLRSTGLVSLTEKPVDIEKTTAVGDYLLEFSNLPQGDYILEETEIPAGYEAVANKTSWNVTISKDAKVYIDNEELEADSIDLTSEYEIMNCEVVTPFSIVKQDESGHTLEGAVFTLSGTLATGKAFTTRTDTVKDDGTIDYGELPEGTYTLTETQLPEGYTSIGGKTTWAIVIAHDRAVTVDGAALADSMLDLTGHYIIHNRLQLNRLQVRKVDEATGANLAGAIFTLTGGSQNITTQMTTNGFGLVEFDNLAYGTYILTETRAPAGYVPSNRTWTITIDGTTNEIIYLGNRYASYTLRVPNTRAVPGEFTLTKVDSATNAPLSGAEFTLTGGNPYMALDGTSAANGTVTFAGLNPGNYTLTETAAPYGYMVTTATRQISVGFDGVVTMGGTDLNVTPLVVTNDAVDPAGFSVRKTSATTAAVLAGAEFTLLNRRTGETQVVVTNAAGIATFSGMLPGAYTLTETAAPAGYIRPTTTWTINVSPEGILSANGLVNGVLNITNATTTTVPGGGRPNRNFAAPPPGDEMMFEFDDMAVPLFGPGMPLTGFLSDNTWLWVLLAVSGATLLAHLLIAMRSKKKKNGKA